MKLLPCKSGRCRGQAALARGQILHSIGSFSGAVLRYICARCGRLSSLTGSEFSRLPPMTEAQITAKTCDLTYRELPPDQQPPAPLPPMVLEPPPTPKPKRKARKARRKK